MSFHCYWWYGKKTRLDLEENLLDLSQIQCPKDNLFKLKMQRPKLAPTSKSKEKLYCFPIILCMRLITRNLHVVLPFLHKLVVAFLFFFLFKKTIRLFNLGGSNFTRNQIVTNINSFHSVKTEYIIVI